MERQIRGKENASIRIGHTENAGINHQQRFCQQTYPSASGWISSLTRLNNIKYTSASRLEQTGGANWYSILPVPVGSPGASGVVRIPRVVGLGVHADEVLPRRLGSAQLAATAELGADLCVSLRSIGSLRSLTEVASCRQSGLKATLGAPVEETSTWTGEKTDGEFEFIMWNVWETCPHLTVRDRRSRGGGENSLSLPSAAVLLHKHRCLRVYLQLCDTLTLWWPRICLSHGRSSMKQRAVTKN